MPAYITSSSPVCIFLFPLFSFSFFLFSIFFFYFREAMYAARALLRASSAMELSVSFKCETPEARARLVRASTRAFRTSGSLWKITPTRGDTLVSARVVVSTYNGTRLNIIFLRFCKLIIPLGFNLQPKSSKAILFFSMKLVSIND